MAMKIEKWCRPTSLVRFCLFLFTLYLSHLF